jgi:hypothetical protein
MTALVGHSRRAVCVEPAAAVRLIFAWSLSPEAAAHAGLPSNCDEPRLEIETPWPGTEGPVRARLSSLDSARDIQLPPCTTRWICDEQAGLVHLEAPGILHATLRANCTTVEVLYARNTVLASLTIGGGRYEFDQAFARPQSGD